MNMLLTALTLDESPRLRWRKILTEYFRVTGDWSVYSLSPCIIVGEGDVVECDVMALRGETLGSLLDRAVDYSLDALDPEFRTESRADVLQKVVDWVVDHYGCGHEADEVQQAEPAIQQEGGSCDHRAGDAQLQDYEAR